MDEFAYLLEGMDDEDFEYVQDFNDDGYIVYVSKVGGGTLGRSYEGAWLYRIADKWGDWFDDDVMHTGTPWQHSTVAAAVLEYAMGFSETE